MSASLIRKFLFVGILFSLSFFFVGCGKSKVEKTYLNLGYTVEHYDDSSREEMSYAYGVEMTDIMKIYKSDTDRCMVFVCKSNADAEKLADTIKADGVQSTHTVYASGKYVIGGIKSTVAKSGL